MSVALHFATPPHGFDPHTRFELREVDGADGLYSMQTADASLRFFVLDAAVYLPDYSPVLSDEQGALIGARSAAEVLLLVVANPGTDGTTVNLLAPVIVNSATGAGAQVILDGQDWPLRWELTAA